MILKFQFLTLKTNLEKIQCSITDEGGCRNLRDYLLQFLRNRQYTVEECYELCSNHDQCEGFLVGRNGRSGDCILVREGCTKDSNRNWVHYSMDDCTKLGKHGEENEGIKSVFY